MIVTVNLWLLIVGAASGVAAVAVSRGRNRYLFAAIIGAVVAFGLGILREAL